MEVSRLSVVMEVDVTAAIERLARLMRHGARAMLPGTDDPPNGAVGNLLIRAADPGDLRQSNCEV